jgi:hypothetical protein
MLQIQTTKLPRNYSIVTSLSARKEQCDVQHLQSATDQTKYRCTLPTVSSHGLFHYLEDCVQCNAQILLSCRAPHPYQSEQRFARRLQRLGIWQDLDALPTIACSFGVNLRCSRASLVCVSQSLPCCGCRFRCTVSSCTAFCGLHAFCGFCVKWWVLLVYRVHLWSGGRLQAAIASTPGQHIPACNVCMYRSCVCVQTLLLLFLVYIVVYYTQYICITLQSTHDVAGR